ncbi:MAG: tetratricopeptide repeat protein [Planctomycetota bacterium]
MKVLRKIGVSVLIVLFVAVGLSFGRSVAKQVLTKGVDYAAQGKFEEAKEEFEKALKAAPFWGAARDSLKVIEDVTERKIERKSAIHLFKGAAYVLKEQWDEGIAEYNKALELNPRFAIAYRTRGFAYCGKGKDDRAISDFTKAIEINPRYADAYFFRGFAFGGKGQYDQAISDYSKAIELNPRHAVAYTNRAVAYYCKGKYTKAWEDIYEAQSLGIQIHPEFLKDLREASGWQECDRLADLHVRQG